MTPRHRPARSLTWALAAVLLVGLAWPGPAVCAEEEKNGAKEKEKSGVLEKPLRVDDLPEPIPKAMEKIKEIGNEVGKGISKATSEAAKGIEKVLKGGKKEDQEKKK